MKQLNAPINVVSEEEVKAMETLPLSFTVGAQEPPPKPWDVRFWYSRLPEAHSYRRGRLISMFTR